MKTLSERRGLKKAKTTQDFIRTVHLHAKTIGEIIWFVFGDRKKYWKNYYREYDKTIVITVDVLDGRHLDENISIDS